MPVNAGTPRHEWQQSALMVLFGEEPEVVDAWPRLRDAVQDLQMATARIYEAARRVADDLGFLATDLLSPGDGVRAAIPADPIAIEAPMRVVLMGRTMAGKSSLLTALTGAHFDRIGDGRQRFSRDTFGATSTMSDHIELVDTPGVGAHGGADDTEKALTAALEADVIVWVNSSDSIQEESAEALRLLGAIGKPIIVAINCRQALQGVGRLNLLKFPERVFGGKDGLLCEIKTHLAAAGVEPLNVVYVHALSATEAQAQPDLDTELLAASRIEALTDALQREYDAHSESRRALRFVDPPRQAAEELARRLTWGAASLRARADFDRRVMADVQVRLARILRISGEAMVADAEAATARRRDWHLGVTDFGDSLQHEWDAQVKAIQDELDAMLQARLGDLVQDLATAIRDTDAEWTSVSADEFALRGLAGFDGVWGNRLLRAGVGVGGAALGLWGGALLGAKIGGVFGLETGPGAIVTAAVGAVVGGFVGVAVGPLKKWIDTRVLGEDGVLHKRRQELAAQVAPILDELTMVYQATIAAQLEQFRDRLTQERVRSDERCASIDRVAAVWTGHADVLRSAVATLDGATASALLRISRRERLARSLARATRVPGVCMLVEFDDSGFWEAWLFPPDLGERLCGGKAPMPGGEAANALSYAMSLVDAPARLVHAGSDSSLVSIAADVPSSILTTWSEALTAHVGRHIDIQTTEKAGTP